MQLMPKVQFNAATGKVIFNAATQKVQMVNPFSSTDCSYCEAGKTPKKLKVVVTGLSDCGCVDKPVGGSIKVTGVAAAINGVEWIVEQYSACSWTTQFSDGPYGSWEKWVSDDCSGDPIFSGDYDSVTVAVVKDGESSLDVRVMMDSGVLPFDAFHFGCVIHAQDEPTINDCMNVEGTLSNAHTSCDSIHLTTGGSATLEEWMS